VIPTNGGTAIQSWGGLLVANMCVKFRDASDGLSNTLLIGEQGGRGIGGDGRTYWYMTAGHGGAGFGAQNCTGWMIGTRMANIGPGGDTAGDGDNRYFNTTTIRYRPNQTPFAGEIFPGMGNNMGPNNPLTSYHTGGVQVALGDGSVRFITENMDLENLKRLATRDEGLPVGEF